MAASEDLCKHKLSPLPGTTSEVWQYFGFDKKDGKLVNRREVSAKNTIGTEMRYICVRFSVKYALRTPLSYTCCTARQPTFD